MKIGIIGYGYVGKAIKEMIDDHYEVLIYDPAMKYNTKEEINSCDLGIICVPTPMNDDGSCDTRIVEQVMDWLKTPLVLIKSTVYPGFTEGYPQAVFSPEYVGESKYYNPIYKTIKETDFIIFGGLSENTQKCVDIFKPILGPLVKYFQTDSRSAELVKYMENTFFATKITFCQEWYDICQAFGRSYDEIREMWLADQRINRMHTSVFKDNRGFKGKCLPKDLLGIIKASEEAGHEPELLKKVVQINGKLCAKD